STINSFGRSMLIMPNIYAFIHQMCWPNYMRAMKAGKKWCRPRARQLSKSGNFSAIAHRLRREFSQKTRAVGTFPATSEFGIMGRRADSVIGIDLGKHVFKGVTLRRKGDSRFVLTSFASRQVPEEFTSADDLARELKSLLKELGGGAKACAVAISDPAALLRIIEQPDTPVELLRNALRLNGLAVLNQECKDFVLDIAPVLGRNAKSGAINENENRNSGNVAVQSGVVTQTRYLVGGMLRPMVKQISAAMSKTRLPADILQLAPVCSFNAFEFAHPEVFTNEAFLLLDMGHLQSTVLIGSKGELVLVRSIDYGGKALMHALTADDALNADAAWLMIQ